jgi:3-hydroxyisobutyrate dehydrogenase-like beta-hydroxyacid dehydrogenase
MGRMTTIAFLGTGTMGFAMAKNLSESGLPVRARLFGRQTRGAHDPVPARVERCCRSRDRGMRS